jgi:hypothetical protein
MYAPICLHCERRPPVDLLGLCADCCAKPCVLALYAVRRRGWTPEWEAHLLRLTERAKEKLPLFEDKPGLAGHSNSC